MSIKQQPARNRDDEDESSERAWGALVWLWFVGLLGTALAWVASVFMQLLRDDDE